VYHTFPTTLDHHGPGPIGPGVKAANRVDGVTGVAAREVTIFLTTVGKAAATSNFFVGVVISYLQGSVVSGLSVNLTTVGKPYNLSVNSNPPARLI